MNTSSAFAPLPTLPAQRRRRQWRIEPLVFALLLTLLTLGINLSEAPAQDEQADGQAAPSQLASAR